MAQKILGVDIGYGSLKLALCKDGNVKKTAVAEMPANLLRDGRITSPEALSELLRETMRKHHIHASRAAVVLPNEQSYIRTVTMPRMTAEQLKYNIPYEFNDYIEDEVKNYVFDYAMISDPKADTGDTMELMAVAAPTWLLDDAKAIMGMAGLRFAKAAPVEYAYLSLIRQAERGNADKREYCFLDIGYRAVRMFMYRGDQHIVTRVLETGLRTVAEAIAEALNVDIHLAHTFLERNYEDCQKKEFCMNAYNNLAVELMRALNFYRFSNPDSTLSDVWLCGGGAGIEALCGVISETLDLNIHPAEELISGGNRVLQCYNYLQAVGITMD